MDFALGIHDPDAAQGGNDLLDGAVVVEIQIINPHRPVLVEIRGQLLVVIEQIPLAIVLHDGMMLGPAAAGVCFRDDAHPFIRSHRIGRN